MRKTDKQYAALTFDDGPSEYTGQVLQILEDYQIKATFFVIGAHVIENREMLKRVAHYGHEIGNHTWSHPDITTISNEKLQEEIKHTNRLVKDLTGITMRIFRPPYGLTTAKKVSQILSLGLFPVLWDINTYDWKLSNPEMICERLDQNLKKQSIILMHDGGGRREATIQALPAIIQNLKEKDFEFLIISEYFKIVYGIDI